tara:strand:- start:175 stop:663 length:489 start_codon:yes stop_codon:yes gene_type:complete
MTMHLQQGLSTINTRKRKVKITKAKYKELELRWREHNKRMKQSHMHHMRYDTLDAYIDYCYGRAYKKPDPRDYRNFTRLNKESQRNWRAEQDAKHREKYPSLMEQQMKEGTFNSKGDGMRKKEPMKYTGDLIQGIATMHKSNAVPVMKGTDQAKDIARMRRG